MIYNKKIQKSASFEDCDILDLELDFYGLCGGDSGHGGYLDLKLSTYCSFYVNGQESTKLHLLFTGDAEIRNFIRVCRYVNKVLGIASMDFLDHPCDIFYDQNI